MTGEDKITFKLFHLVFWLVLPVIIKVLRRHAKIDNLDLREFLFTITYHNIF
jgi:hypothetical protein